MRSLCCEEGERNGSEHSQGKSSPETVESFQKGEITLGVYAGGNNPGERAKTMAEQRERLRQRGAHRPLQKGAVATQLQLIVASSLVTQEKPENDLLSFLSFF